MSREEKVRVAIMLARKLIERHGKDIVCRSAPSGVRVRGIEMEGGHRAVLLSRVSKNMSTRINEKTIHAVLLNTVQIWHGSKIVFGAAFDDHKFYNFKYKEGAWEEFWTREVSGRHDH